MKNQPGKKTPAASPAIAFLHKVVGPKGTARYGWHHILAAIHHAGEDPSVEAERVLHKIVDFKGTIVLTPRAGVTHCMSPENMMRSLALQALLQRNKGKHRKLAHQLARSTRSDLLACIAKSSAR